MRCSRCKPCAQALGDATNTAGAQSSSQAASSSAAAQAGAASTVGIAVGLASQPASEANDNTDGEEVMGAAEQAAANVEGSRRPGNVSVPSYLKLDMLRVPFCSSTSPPVSEQKNTRTQHRAGRPACTAGPKPHVTDSASNLTEVDLPPQKIFVSNRHKLNVKTPQLRSYLLPLQVCLV
jgi:hypothetical protein